MGKRIRIAEDDFTFWVDGEGKTQYRGATNAEAARKVSEVGTLVEQWLQLHKDPPRILPSVNPSSLVRSSGPRSRRDAFPCAYCKLRFGSENQAQQHVLESHVAEDSDKSPRALSKPLVRIDGEVFERRSLRLKQGHLAKSLPLRKTVKSVRPMTKCEACGVEVRCDRAARHLMENCRVARQTMAPEATLSQVRRADFSSPRRLTNQTVSGGSAELVRAPIPGSKGLSFGARDSNSNSRKEYKEERRLDGSRDFYNFREQGRFGSHPSFDACDDESAP